MKITAQAGSAALGAGRELLLPVTGSLSQLSIFSFPRRSRAWELPCPSMCTPVVLDRSDLHELGICMVLWVSNAPSFLFPRRNKASTAWAQGQPKVCGRQEQPGHTTAEHLTYQEGSWMYQEGSWTYQEGSWFIFPCHIGCWERGKTGEFISSTSPC